MAENVSREAERRTPKNMSREAERRTAENVKNASSALLVLLAIAAIGFLVTMIVIAGGLGWL